MIQTSTRGFLRRLKREQARKSAPARLGRHNPFGNRKERRTDAALARKK